MTHDGGRRWTVSEITARLATRSWVTLPQMAKLCGLHYSTVREAVQRGRIKAFKVGGRSRVYEAEVIRFLIEGNYIGEHTLAYLNELGFDDTIPKTNTESSNDN